MTSKKFCKYTFCSDHIFIKIFYYENLEPYGIFSNQMCHPEDKVWQHEAN